MMEWGWLWLHQMSAIAFSHKWDARKVPEFSSLFKDLVPALHLNTQSSTNHVVLLPENLKKLIRNQECMSSELPPVCFRGKTWNTLAVGATLLIASQNPAITCHCSTSLSFFMWVGVSAEKCFPSLDPSSLMLSRSQEPSSDKNTSKVMYYRVH